jgi:thiamine pyrophosphate-dependent acetolactate synthase large subunit-like protein
MRPLWSYGVDGADPAACSLSDILPDMTRYAPAPTQRASESAVERIADALIAAERPVLLIGRGSRSQVAWDNRVRFAETLGASVLTSIRERAAFPTALQAAPPSFWLTPTGKKVVQESDAILSLDWVDLNGLFQQVTRRTAQLRAKIARSRSRSCAKTARSAWRT